MIPFLRFIIHRLAATGCSLLERFRQSRLSCLFQHAGDDIPITILLDDPHRCRRLRRSLRRALRQLPALSHCRQDVRLIVIVQQALTTNRQICSNIHFVSHANDTPTWLIQLALSMNGRALSIDEVLASLADRWIDFLRAVVDAQACRSTSPAEYVPADEEGTAAAVITARAEPGHEPAPVRETEGGCRADLEVPGPVPPVETPSAAERPGGSGTPETSAHEDAFAAMPAAAEALWRGGLSLIPIDAHTKRPDARFLPFDSYGKRSWKPFQARRAELEVVLNWVRHGAQLAAVCGRISGGEPGNGLLVLDFDSPRFYADWRIAAGALAENLPVQRTGGGGYQVWLRCANPGPNTKLAWETYTCDSAHLSDPGRRIAVETRGEGGYAIVAPSLHPSGRRYTVLAGDFAAVPCLSQEQADTLLQAARDLDEAPHSQQELERMRSVSISPVGEPSLRPEQSSVIERFNASTSCAEMLERYGYRLAGHYPGYSRYIRPSGQEPSVTVFGRSSKHWNSNDPLSAFNNRDTHAPFDLFCFYEHHGDVSAAVKAVAALLAKQTEP